MYPERISPNSSWAYINTSECMISGEIRDADSGATIPFVAIRFSETERGIQSDLQGRFSLACPIENESLLIFSMTGYETLMIVIANQPGYPDFLRIELKPDIFNLQEVIVTGSPTGSGVRYQPSQAYNQADIIQRKDVTVGHILDGEPGIAMRSFGPAPSRPVIRGLDGERVLILENGERMGDISESAADHAVAIDPSVVNRIEIVRGPASLLYGNSAMGGVINLLTNDIPHDWSQGVWGSVSGSIASVNSLGMSTAQVGYGNEAFAFTTRGSFRGAGDLRTPTGRLSGTGLSKTEGTVGIGYRSETIQGGITVMGMNSWFGIPGDSNDPNNVEIRYQRTTMQLRLDGQRKGFFDKYQIKGHFSDYAQQEVDIRNENGSKTEDIPLTYDQRSMSTTLYFQHQPFGLLNRGVLGFNVNGRMMDVGGSDAYTPGDQYLNMALFTIQEISINRWFRLQGGLRLDSRSIKPRYRNEGLYEESGKINTDLAGSVGINIRPNSSIEIGLQAAKAHRYPTIEELYSNGVHLGAGSFERGNPNLKSESGYGVDAFLRAYKGLWTVELASYSMWIQHFIRFEPTGEVDLRSGFPVFEYRSGRARIMGSEGYLTGQLGANWSVKTGADLVFGQVTGLNSHPLPSIPPIRVSSQIRYDRSYWWAQANVKHVMSQERVAPEELPTDGYSLLSGTVGFVFGDTRLHRMVLRVDNALNTSYRDHLSRVEDRDQIMPARSLNIIYTLNF